MISWLENIFNFVSGFINAITNGISDVINKIISFFNIVGEFIEFLYNAVQLIPLYYQIFGTIIIFVLIILVILGRGAGGD